MTRLRVSGSADRASPGHTAASGAGSRRATRGLTLVEVVVGLAVLSLVTLVIGASLRGLSRSAERVDERSRALDEVRTASAFLHDTLERARPTTLATPERTPVFAPLPQGLVWAAVMPPRHGVSGLHAFRLSVEPAAAGAALVLRYAPLTSDATALPDWGSAEHRVVAAQVTSVAVRVDGQGLNEGWLDEWTDARLPARVRIDVATTTGPWPPLVIPVPPPLRGNAGPFAVGGSER